MKSRWDSPLLEGEKVFKSMDGAMGRIRNMIFWSVS